MGGGTLFFSENKFLVMISCWNKNEISLFSLIISVTSILIWPSVQYHNILQKMYLKFEPVFMKLDYSMKSKSKWHYQTGK